MFYYVRGMELILHFIYFYRLVHSSAFRGKLDNYTFLNTSFPWEIYEGTFCQLGDASYKRNRALLLENEQPFVDDTFFHHTLGIMIRLISCLRNFNIDIQGDIFSDNTYNILHSQGFDHGY